MQKDQLVLMAQYNVWATAKLMQRLREIPEAKIHADCGLFFKSIFATLNHLLVGEHLLWYPRFAQGVSPALQLDQIVETDLEQLYQALEYKSQRWIDLIQQLDLVRLEGSLDYHSSRGQALSLPYAATLMHVFNHATHHRGQITAALSMQGEDCPALDLVYMLLEQSTDS